MITLRKRGKVWYWDRQKILNSDSLVSLDDAILDKKQSKIFDSEEDNLLVMDSYDEMICELRNMYAAQLRFYEDFQTDHQIIWLNYDCGIKYFELYRLDHEETFLGKWVWNFKEKIYSSVSVMCSRYLVVRKEWYNEARKALIREGYMRKELLI
jgi:hypothetical protein